MESIRNRLNPIKIEQHSGKAIQAGNQTITPISRSVRFQIPFRKAGVGVIWNRPVAVTVQTGSEEPRRLPIVDATRQMQLLIWLSAIVMVGLLRIFIRVRRSE